MPETSPTTPVEPEATLTPPPTTSPPPTSTPPTTTTPSSETQKPAETQKASDGQKSILNEKGPDAREGAPEKYTDYKVPEGFELDPEVATQANTLFKELDISQSGAQKLVDLYAKLTKEAFDAPFNAFMDKRQEWRDEISSHPEIGGSKLNGVKASIGRLIDSFGDAKTAEAFREAMDVTSAGDHPAVVYGLWRLSQRLTEGGPVRGGGPSTEGQRAPGEGRPSAAQAIYPNLPSTSRG